MKTDKGIDEIRDEIQVVTLARDFFKQISCSRKGEPSIRIIAATEEKHYGERLEDLEKQLAKAAK